MIKGTVYVNNGKWYYMVRLPGETKRTARKLCAPGSDVAMSSDRPREMAIQAAYRIWESATKPAPTTAVVSMTMDQICDAWVVHAREYYRNPDGTPTGEHHNAALAVRFVREVCGDTPVTAATHRDMLNVRDAMIRHGLARVTVNRYISIQKRMLAWALDEGMIPALAKAELTQVVSIKPNRTKAPETEPVRPVSDADVEKTLAVMVPNTADLVRLQRLTGMRPEEACAFCWKDVDETATPWVYQPGKHKNKWRGHVRAVLIGPRARAILERHRRSDGSCPFSPIAAYEEWAMRLESERNDRGGSVASDALKDPHVPRKLSASWATNAYSGSIAAACRRANVQVWSANRLRHTFATEVRRKFGIAVVGILLGHSNGRKVTDGYSRDAAIDEIVREGGPVIEQIG